MLLNEGSSTFSFTKGAGAKWPERNEMRDERVLYTASSKDVPFAPLPKVSELRITILRPRTISEKRRHYQFL